MAFIKIYQKLTLAEYNFGKLLVDVNLSHIVDEKNLTKEQYEDLRDYLIENSKNMSGTPSFEMYLIKNTKEQMENMPLGDGVVIHTSQFYKNQEYIIAIGETDKSILLRMLLGAE